jgi:hypothetical protein
MQECVSNERFAIVRSTKQTKPSSTPFRKGRVKYWLSTLKYRLSFEALGV